MNLVMRIRLLIVWLILSLLSVAVFGLSPNRDANLQVSMEGAIEVFSEKLEQSINIQNDLILRIDAIEKRNAELIKSNNELERNLGLLRNRQNKLKTSLVMNEKKVSEYKDAYKTEKGHYDQIDNELKSYKEEKAKHERWMRKCKRKTGPLSFSCNIADELGKVVGKVKTHEEKIKSSSKRLKIIEDNLMAAEDGLRESKSKVKKERSDESKISNKIDVTENEIKVNKKQLSDLRAEVYENRILLDDFNRAFDEANSIKEIDRRARVIRRMEGMAVLLDKLIACSSLLTNQSKELTVNDKKACS